MEWSTGPDRSLSRECARIVRSETMSSLQLLLLTGGKIGAIVQGIVNEAERGWSEHGWPVHLLAS